MNPNTHLESYNTLSFSPSSTTRLMRLALYLPRTTDSSTDFEAMSRLYAQYLFFLSFSSTTKLPKITNLIFHSPT